MDLLDAREEYRKAVRSGQKEVRELRMQGKNTAPEVLDAILGDGYVGTSVDVGLVDIPIERIVGTKTAGRITAFSAGFMPLLPLDTEFAHKWINLCSAHMSDEGIRNAIVCFEYLGKFYVQEGNKRVSVLRYFGAARVPGTVCRIMPPVSDEPRIKAYYEFLEFYKATGLYDVQFRQPGEYAKLMSFLGKDISEKWTEREQRTFRAYFQYFREAFNALGGEELDLLPEEALLLWLRVYSFRDLGQMSSGEIKQALSNLWRDVVAISRADSVQVETEAEIQARGGLLSMLLPTAPAFLRVAFVYQLHPDISTWAKGHEDGAEYMYRVLSDRVSIRHYYNADTPEQAEALLEQAVLDGADVVFATTPKLSRPTLKMAVKYPQVRFLNCSVDAPYSSVRTYYSRIYEGKFITGAIAGAMANNDRIGYIGSYPIFGVPASINAFALGAQLTNPRAKVDLRWSCQGGNPVEDFIRSGINVISNRDVPTPDKMHLEFGTYGTYMVENGILQPLGSPCWLWGNFYENVIRTILNGNWEKNKEHSAVNYWWGMDSGVIDVELAESLPAGLLQLANLLREELRNGTLDPFRRKLVAQDGRVINTGDRSLSPDELLHMDWLCENVEGCIPAFDQIAPFAQDMVRELGVYRDSIPMEKEGAL